LFFYYTCMVFYHNWQPFWGFLFIIQNNHVVQRQVHATKLFFWAIIAEGRGSRPARGISQLHWTLHHSLMQLSRFMLTMVEIWLGLLWVYHFSYIVLISERSAAKLMNHSWSFNCSLLRVCSVSTFLYRTQHISWAIDISYFLLN